MIEFLCPNGHRIRCPAEQAGRPAKCPRCGVRFLVPSPDDADVSEAVGSDSGISRPDFTDSDVSKKSPSGLGSSLKEPQIEFLCPNGHRLHGSPSLQGKPGQCPECGSRFRIPSFDEMAPQNSPTQEINLGKADSRIGSASGTKLPPAPAPSPAAPSLPDEPFSIPTPDEPFSIPTPDSPFPIPTPSAARTPTEEVAMPTTISGRGAAVQSMAAIVTRLWEMRPKDATVELRLRDGETLIVHQFLKKLSHDAHQGVFAVNETDGSVSLTAVAWDAIARATLRGLKELPKGLAD